MTVEPITVELATMEPATVEAALVRATSRAAPARSRQAAPSRPPQPLPFVIDPPRGGMIDETDRRAAAAEASGMRARDTVLSAIWPILSASAGPAPGPAAATISDASVARVRRAVATAVASFRSGLGAAARDFDGAERVAIEDLAMTMKVDEAELLDRIALLLSPQQLVAASVPGRTAVADAVERVVGARVETHMLELVQNHRRLTETTRALVLFSLSARRD